MNSGKIVAGRVDGTGRDGTSKVLQEVLADLRKAKIWFLSPPEAPEQLDFVTVTILAIQRV